MWLWIVLVVLAVMAALLIYAACCVDGDIDRQSEAHCCRAARRNQRKDETMAKYEMLIAASGKRGSALLPCVVVDEKGIKRAAVRAKAMARACYPEYEKFNVVKMKVISDE